MSRLIAFLRRAAPLGVAFTVVLWPIAYSAPYLVSAPILAVFLVFVSTLVLYLVHEASDLWRRRRGAAAILLAAALLLPYGAINVWLVESVLRSHAREELQRERERQSAVEAQQLFERVRAQGSVPVSDLADGWDRVCVVWPYNDFADGRLQMEDSWGLDFFRGGEAVATRDYRRRDVELVDTAGQHCLPRAQEPAFFIASAEWNPQALRIRPTRP